MKDSQSVYYLEEIDLKIRLVEKKDYGQVLEILNAAIEKRLYTALLKAVTLKDREAWFEKHESPKYPLFVAEIDGKVVGWISIEVFREKREGFLGTVELSYYVDEKYRNNKVASALMAHILIIAKHIGYKNVIAVIFDNNLASQKLVIKNGFERWGHLPDVIEIDGKMIGCDYWGLKLYNS